MAQGEPLALLRHADTGRDIHPYGCPDQLAGAILCGGHEPLYILVNIINYASEYETLMKANCDKTEEEKSGEASPKKAYIETLRPRVTEWIQEKSYLKDQFTIDDLATRLYTNKTYLSSFIKEEFGMNFSSWIASLRLEEAKKMMSEHPDAKLKDIAYNVGFSSLPYFSSVFAKSEGVTPSAWMKEISRNAER